MRDPWRHPARWCAPPPRRRTWADPGNDAAYARDLALEIAQTRLARVAPNNLLQRLLREFDLQVAQPVFDHLLGDQMAADDLELLLFRVTGQLQHFQQRRGRVAAKIRSQLVDFIENEERIIRARVAQPLNYAPWERADVGAAMAADFRLVADSTK